MTTYRIFAVATFALAFMLGISGMQREVKAERLASQGANATATVLDKGSNFVFGRRDVDEKFRIAIAFAALERPGYIVIGVPKALFDFIHTGDEIPVRYWTKDPTVFEIGEADSESRNWRSESAVTLAIASIFALLGMRRTSANL